MKNQYRFSLLTMWALAFGCAVGSDAFVMPWTTFLPEAGPFGTIFGIVAGGLVMTVIAWNYHYMMNRHPGPGGVYTYASEVFGHDHGFLCGYFLGFAYASIIWLDLTALVTVAHYMMGDMLCFGFSYTIEGRSVYLGDIVFAMLAIAGFAAICCRSRVSGRVQTTMALIFAGGIVLFFLAALFHKQGGIAAMRPAFSPTGGWGIVQFLGIFAIAPWLFVGIETISNMSSEFRFPLKKSFMVLVMSIVTTIVAYLLLTAIPLFASGSEGWPATVASIGDAANQDIFAFEAARVLLGGAGWALLGLTLIGGIVTNLVGNTIAASRLAAAMADDGAFPSWFGQRDADGSPRNAVLIIACFAILVVPLGRTVIGVVVDIAIIGAAIAYGYTSAAAFKTARLAGDRRTQVSGVFGVVVSAAVIFLLLMPILSSGSVRISTMSYLILVGWGISGLAIFVTVFRRDSLRRFGQSPIVWLSMFVMIVLLAFMWMRQVTRDTTERAYASVVRYHSEHCMHEGQQDLQHHQDDVVNGWRDVLRKNLDTVGDSIFIDNLVQGGLYLLALALMLCIYSTLRRRERDIVQEKANAKSYFFSTVSHDIRTPLNAIIGFSEMIKAGFKTEAERNQAMDAIIVSGKTLLGLINDVLDLSKLESGKMQITLEPTDCGRLVRDLTEAFRVSNTKPNVDIRCSFGRMPLIMVDPQRLRQIVFNLFGNAMKFTTRGYVALRVSFDCGADASKGLFRLDVEDTGCGIGEEDLKRIGSAYVQVGSRVGRNGGTGLGLAICKQLAAAMGGRLEVKSEFGKGSTFSVIIPDVKVASDAPPEASDASDASTPLEKPEVAVAAESAPSIVRRILLVDDSKMNIMVLKAQLKHLGDFELETAMDGAEALKILESPDTKPFDLVLTDMWMPRLDGEGLVKAIRAKEGLSSMRVVVVTADVEFQGKFAEMGFDGILLKPVTADKLSTIFAK